MHCELLVPRLFATGAALRCAALELLLARGRRRAAPAQSVEEWLNEAFDLGDGPFPAGALTLLAQGGDPGDASWARADPVHLRVMRDHLIVVPAAAFDLPATEAGALCDALNAHFAGADFRLHDARRWCAKVAEAVDGGNPLDAAGRQVDLPARAATFINEAQMVLHAHPVNEAREARGEPTVNSIWLWGPGRATRALCAWQSVASDDPAVMGAARLAGVRYRSLPRSGAEWLERLPEDGRHLALLDTVRIQPALEQLEHDWFAPLLAALRAGRIGMVSLHVPDGAEALSFETIRADLRRFWRMAKPIEHYA
jgi:hypothetical protein